MGQSEKTINLTLPEDQIWENLKISNDFMFAKVMRNPELCKGMLERLLDIAIAYIEYPEEQKVIDISKDSKSVRLDVYLHDEKNTVYNIEIQTSSKRNLPKRTRYYSGMIDLNAIEKGADYSELPQSLVIFICTFDAFGDGRWKYTFENICMENKKLILNDKSYKVFFNTKGTKGRISKAAKNILKLIENNTTEDNFTKKLAQEVQKIKENKEWQVEYMTLLMREREKYTEGMAKGIADGMADGKAYGIIKFTSGLGYSDENIISALQETLDIDMEHAKDYLKRYYRENF